MNKKSIWAIVAGILVVIIVTTIVDVVLHLTHVYPPMDQPIDDRLALLATAYRIVISIGGAWLTARLAPDKPMKHVMILAIWNRGLGPRWYPIALAVLAIPQSWAGGKLYETQSGQH